MRASRAWLASLLLLPLAGCQDDGGGRDGEAVLPERTAPAGMNESLRDAALALVEAREQALVDGDREAFLATIDPAADAFARSQARWWDNVAQLPASDFALDLGDEDVMTRVAGAGDLQLPVDFTMRLDGYDEGAVTQPLVYTFVGDADEVHLTSDRNLQSDAFTGWVPAPWDVTAITVEESDGVLAVFDDGTRADADRVHADIVAARDAIRPLLPPWSGRVVAYDISDVDAIDEMSAMTVDDTGGVAFPVTRRPGSRRSVAYRFAVNPVHTAGGAWRGILFRHELVHVALGDADDRSPTWLTEGAAEHVAYAAAYDEVTRRRILAGALAGVTPRSLATGRDFYQRDPRVNYDLAHLACAYLASTGGEDALWDLVRSFRRREALLPGDVEDLVRAEVGMSTEQLVSEALAWARSA
ncbi:hypothetical protein KDN32_05910 [Nocardioides sp. J2M5]|uniref:hypothetical protein n=1 Tax=Nocardioides palaemonis TaxID=2829810 RepID=UPI001BA53D5A|nr:hypothetical protein [Nocardioides palaemonis]MBS2937271.1 hypothetical protein [Nocardioides palaemonis]